jgi:hypothetical protein
MPAKECLKEVSRLQLLRGRDTNATRTSLRAGSLRLDMSDLPCSLIRTHFVSAGDERTTAPG